MRFVKCPRCEVNYMSADDEMCTICRRELKGGRDTFETVEICSECGENSVVPGKELCAACLKELSRNTTTEESEEIVTSASELTELDAMSCMDEIVPDTQDLVEDLSEDDFSDDDDYDDDDEEEDD